MEYIQARRSRRRALEKDVEKWYHMKSKLEQANNELMSEREEKKALQKDLGKTLNHGCDNAAYKLDTLKKWHARTLHELEMSNEKLKQAERQIAQVEKCPICYQCPPQVTTACGHSFCRSCIGQHERIWGIRSRCPMCRENLRIDSEGILSLTDI